jgi:RNA polymerase primary sigma factor
LLSTTSRVIRLPHHIAQSSELRRNEPAPVSLSESIGSCEGDLEELLGDGGEGDPARRVDSGPNPEDALSRVDARARRIVELRYGLGGGRPRTLTEVGRELGVSRQRVRQLERQTLLELGRILDAA